MDNSRQNSHLSVSGLIKPGYGKDEKYSFPRLPGNYDYLSGFQKYPDAYGKNVRPLMPEQMIQEPTFHPGRPFYMQVPNPGDEKSMLQDLDYLKRMYPDVVKEYMVQVSEMLDKLDYEGSMIYDEYPDYYQLKRLSLTVVDMIRRKEREQMVTPDGDVMHWEEKNSLAPEELRDTGTSEDKWVWVEYLVRILVSLEVFRRRNRKSRYY